VHQKAIENIVRIFADFNEAHAALGPVPLGPLQEEGVMFMQGNHLFYARREALLKYKELLSKFATPEWKSKWSESHRTKLVQGAMATALDEGDGGLRAFSEVVTQLDQESPRYDVVIPISGIDLNVPNIQIGDVEVLRMTRALADEILSKAEKMLETKAPQLRKAILDLITKDVDGLVDVTCLKVQVTGDPAKAQEDAERACLPAIDVLQVIVGLFVDLDAEVRVDFRSFNAGGYRPILLISQDNDSVSPHKARFGAAGACAITPDILETRRVWL